MKIFVSLLRTTFFFDLKLFCTRRISIKHQQINKLFRLSLGTNNFTQPVFFL